MGNYQLNQFLMSRKNRLLLLVLWVALGLYCLYKVSFSSNSTGYKENVTDKLTIPFYSGNVLYSFPKTLITRLSKLETKLSNLTSFIFSVTQASSQKHIFSKYFNNFMDENVHEFWNVNTEKNKSMIASLYSKNISSHATTLVSFQQCHEPLRLLVLITTHVTHFDRRDAIRKTWGKDVANPPRWKTYFLIGRAKTTSQLVKIKREIQEYDDLILGNVDENFYNLTYKVQMGFEWSLKYCNFEYLLKGDDDVFINMQQVFQFLESKDVPSTELYAGNVQYQAQVFRSGRYGVEKKEFNKNIYPRYCSGGGFILSHDVIEKIYRLFNTVPVLKIDDAYIGILALKAAVDVVHNDRFRMFEDEDGKNRCVYTKNHIVYHPVKIRSCMEYLFKQSIKF